MSRLHAFRGWPGRGLLGLALGAALVALPLSKDSPASAQAKADDELPLELRYVPADAAVFAHVDAAAIWDNDILKSVRKADGKFFDDLIGRGKTVFGLTPDDVKTVTVFIPNAKNPFDITKLGVVVTFKKAYDAEKIKKGAEDFLPKNLTVTVKAINDRTALVLVGLDDEYAKPRPAGEKGPLSAAIKEAATGKHAVTGGLTMANLPELLQGDDLPAQLRAFQPIFKSTTLSATVDLGKTIEVGVKVKAGTAAQASECEKSLGALLGLIQDGLNEGLKELDGDKEAGIKDVLTILKAGITATKGAKFETLGNETSVRVSIPTDLPFTSAYLAAKKKVQDAAAGASSANNLKQIALAMHNYHDTHDVFPPASVVNKDGKPLLSWRVLILPYIEQEALYKEFKLDEPWDSEHNKKLIPKMPKIYALPGKSGPNDTTTYYQVFVGKGAGFDWVMSGKITEITDGTSNTLMCVTAEKAVTWTKPEDIEFDPEKDMTRLIGMHVNGRMQAAYFDGSVRTFKKIPAKQTLNALITRAGGEVIVDDLDK